jgi:hypothetical protein
LMVAISWTRRRLKKLVSAMWVWAAKVCALDS